MAECRGLFGVMMKQDAQGNKYGHRMKPFNYTGKKVIGPVRFEKMFWTEVNRVNNLKTTGTSQSVYWKERGEGLEGGAYQAKYGRHWKKKVVDQLGKGSDAVCNVTDLMDHAIAEGRRLFRGTYPPHTHSPITRHTTPGGAWMFHEHLSTISPSPLPPVPQIITPSRSSKSLLLGALRSVVV